MPSLVLSVGMISQTSLPGMTPVTAKITDWLVFLLFSVLEPSVVSVFIPKAVL
jgi:hypothetical protein